MVFALERACQSRILRDFTFGNLFFEMQHHASQDAAHGERALITNMNLHAQ